MLNVFAVLAFLAFLHFISGTAEKWVVVRRQKKCEDKELLWPNYYNSAAQAREFRRLLGDYIFELSLCKPARGEKDRGSLLTAGSPESEDLLNICRDSDKRFSQALPLVKNPPRLEDRLRSLIEKD